MTVLLFDSDMLLFRAVSSVETEVEWSTDIWAKWTDISEAREKYWDWVEHFCQKYDAHTSDCWHCFTDDSAFRKKLSPDYKAGRKTYKPCGYAQLKRELLKMDKATIYEQIEADDMLSILTEVIAEKTGEPSVLVSGDKDLRQVPGQHDWIEVRPSYIGAYPEDPSGLLFEHTDYDKTEFYVTPQEAERYAWYQCVAGDSTDGVKGCPGYGAKRARQFANTLEIENPVATWQAVISLFKKAGKTTFSEARQAALLQARLTRVLKYNQYDFNTHIVSLWNPPTLSS